MWSGISGQNFSPLYWILERMNAISYCDILEHIMIPEVLNNDYTTSSSKQVTCLQGDIVSSLSLSLFYMPSF